MTLVEYTHHSAQRQNKVSVKEFFAMSSENSVEDQLHYQEKNRTKTWRAYS